MLEPEEVRRRVAAIVRAAAPEALVVERWLFDLDEGQWARLLTPEHERRIHAWLVACTSIVTVERLANRRCYEFGVTVAGYRQYESGTHLANSAVEFEAECMAVMRAVNRSHLLGFSKDEQAALKEVTPLSFPALRYAPMGGWLTHHARGEMTVRQVEFIQEE